MTIYFDDLETRSPEQREAEHMARLAVQVGHAQSSTVAFAKILHGIHAQDINSRQSLVQLPVTRKHELLALQQAARPADSFGGFSALVRGPAMTRIFASPGPVYEPEGARANYWRSARAMFAAGFRAGDLVHNSFSYHMTPGAFMMESGAMALGCTVFPAGTGQTEQQLAAMSDLRPVAFAGTPSFLRILIEKAEDMGVRIDSLQKALVSGEPFPASLRDWLAQRGIDAFQCYATADLGLVAYETQARQGLVVDEGVVIEVVRPGTSDPVSDGEVGELVVTSLNPDYPLIRFGTGDLTAILPGACPSGRTNVRIRGWLGRADQTTKARGMFVHPAQVDQIAKRFPEVLKARMVVSGVMAKDELTLRVEAHARSTELQNRIAETVREVTKLRADVVLLEPGTLPNDGKVIEDARSHQ